MNFVYYPKGVCSQKYTFEFDNDVIKNVIIEGGCMGNLTGISRIIKDMKVDEVIEDFLGVKCGRKNTSCPDQIAHALMEYKETYLNK